MYLRQSQISFFYEHNVTHIQIEWGLDFRLLN